MSVLQVGDPPAPPNDPVVDLARLVDGGRYELVDGTLRERHLGAVSSWVNFELMARVREYVRAHALGWVLTVDTGYQCFGDPTRNVRYPDGSVIRFGRLPGETLPAGHVPIPPDLAVEVVSPRDLAIELDEKVQEYLQGGVKLVWVINPQTRTARVHRADGTITQVTEQQDLEGEAVLPGFRCRLGDILTPMPPALQT